MDTRITVLAFVFAVAAVACERLDGKVTGVVEQKARGGSLDLEASQFPLEQDLAILLPRDREHFISTDEPTASGADLLPARWLSQVKTAYEETDVGSAIEDENFDSQWRVVSIRVAPCSPLGRHLGQKPSELCWPEVRLVWQPVLHDHHLGWMVVDSFSDDRAIHALYHVHTPDRAVASKDVLRRVSEQLGPGQRRLVTPELKRRFEEERSEALAYLMDEVYALRDADLSPQDYERLDYRAETYEYHELAGGFYSRLGAFLSTMAGPEDLHTLTSFSLPAGREPATIDTWVFIAFEGKRGILTQRSLTVTDPDSGEEFADVGMSETVDTTGPDEFFSDLLEQRPDKAAQLRSTVVMNGADRVRLKDRLNDPNQTLVPNTSCASCHSFNELRFNFHNLSYLQEMDITVAPRVVADVEHDMNWVNGHR